MDFLFLMDPLESVNTWTDTTYALMRKAFQRGHAVWFAEPSSLELRQGIPWVRSRQVDVPGASSSFSWRGADEWRELATFPIAWIRKDPPFDLGYVETTWMLDRADRARCRVLNDPTGIRGANEKLYALRFPDLIPESLVSADPERCKAFMESLGGEMIIKPLDGCGGAGVFHVHRGDRNLNAILELSTSNGTRLVMAQRYLPAVRDDGDKRLIVLDGEPLGAIRRGPREDEHRGNIHVGGRVERSAVDARDREICRRMAPRLAADGLYFVGLDVIGGLVTEVNVTSPTGVQEIDRLDGSCLEARVLDFVETRAATLDRAAAPR